MSREHQQVPGEDPEGEEGQPHRVGRQDDEGGTERGGGLKYEPRELVRKERIRFWLAFGFLLWPLGPLVAAAYVVARLVGSSSRRHRRKGTLLGPLRLWLTYPAYLIRMAWRRGNLRLAAAVLLVLPIFLATIWAGAFWTDIESLSGAGTSLQSPSEHLPMGTDALGRGIFAQIAAGARHSYLVGLLAVVVALAVGISGGRMTDRSGLDSPIMTVVQLMEAVPLLVLLMVVLALFSDSSSNVQSPRLKEILRVGVLGVVMGVGLSPPMLRLVRERLRAFKSEEFVTAAKAHGIAEQRIVWKHIILMNTLNEIVVLASQTFASALLMDISVGYVFSIGSAKLGGEPYASWAWLLLSPESKNALIGNVAYGFENWWLWFFPTFFSVATVMGFFLFGDGLRRLGSPRQNYRMVEVPSPFEDLVLEYCEFERGRRESSV